MVYDIFSIYNYVKYSYVPCMFEGAVPLAVAGAATAVVAGGRGDGPEAAAGPAKSPRVVAEAEVGMAPGAIVEAGLAMKLAMVLGTARSESCSSSPVQNWPSGSRGTGT